MLSFGTRYVNHKLTLKVKYQLGTDRKSMEIFLVGTKIGIVIHSKQNNAYGLFVCNQCPAETRAAKKLAFTSR